MSWQPTKHDPTPWSRNWQCVLDADKRVILTAEEGGPRKGERATYYNAARAVACVNACDGIADPAAALAEVRRRLEGLARELPYVIAAIDAREADDFSAEALREHIEEVRAALALLGGAGR
jgi:hypothetical protein